MQHFEMEIEIAAPVAVVYNQWLQVGEHPEYMEGVTDSGTVDHRRLYWSSTFLGKDVEWDIELLELDPDTRMKWRSTFGPRLEGEVTFAEEGEKTRMRFAMDFAAEELGANVEEVRAFMEDRTQKNIVQFKDFIERRGRETGGWSTEFYSTPKV